MEVIFGQFRKKFIKKLNKSLFCLHFLFSKPLFYQTVDGGVYYRDYTETLW